MNWRQIAIYAASHLAVGIAALVLIALWVQV